MGPKSAGFQQGSGDVVGKVPEAQGGAAQVLETAADGLGGSVTGAGPVEAGQDVRVLLLQRPAQAGEGALG